MIPEHYMLDTNTISYIARGRSIAARLRLAEFEGSQQLFVSAICEAELRYGLARRPAAYALNKAVHVLLAKVQVLPWGTAESIVYGRLRSELEANGKPLSSIDTLIAAHTISVGAVLVTGDAAFKQVAELRVENWATDV